MVKDMNGRLKKTEDNVKILSDQLTHRAKPVTPKYLYQMKSG